MDTRARILFIDDEELVLSALRRTLRKEPYEMWFTSEPESALRLVKEHGIEIVVSDHSMPGMTGVEFFGLLHRLHRDVLRVMMTGQADRATTIRAINDGQVHRFLEKPWNDDELKAVLGEMAQIVAARELERRSALAGRSSIRFRTIQKSTDGVIVLPDPRES